MTFATSIKEYVQFKKLELAKDFNNLNHKVTLAIVQVGDNQASNAYIKGKIADAKEVGVNAKLYRFNDNITQDDLIKFVGKLNKKKSINGIIVQLPLPVHISEYDVKLAIAPEKDVDGFHPLSACTPCTPFGIIKYLQYCEFPFTNCNAVVLGRSNIVGKPIAELLTKLNANVTVLHSKSSDENKIFYLQRADLIISATGHIGTITKSMKLKKKCVVIDVGMNRDENGKLIGDCERNLDVVYQSPVPGGVGLLTRLALYNNLYYLTRAQ